MYSVFHSKGTQRRGCCALTLALLRAYRASMSPQDWAQITFRSEMHLNDFDYESGSWWEKMKNSRSGDFSTIYWVFQKWFLLLYWILTSIDLNLTFTQKFLCSNNLEGHKLKSHSVCSGWLKQESFLGHPCILCWNHQILSFPFS